MNPSALFAAQYAEAIKLRTNVDPILQSYEDLRISFLDKDPVRFNSAVASIRNACEERAPDQVGKITEKLTMNSNLFIVVL